MRAATWVKPPYQTKEGWHFQGGCYSWIDVGNVPGGVAILDPGFYFFNGFWLNSDPSGITAGGLAVNAGDGQLLGQDVTLEFVKTSSFSGTAIAPWDKNVPACGNGGQQRCYLGADPSKNGAYTFFSAPCDKSVPGCPMTNSQWCPSSDESCFDQLVYAPPPDGSTPYGGIGGAFSFKGTGSYEWIVGNIFWPGVCVWTANGDSILLGSVKCNTISLQGGSISAGAAVDFGGKHKPPTQSEPGLRA
jgi:hypothetical protein